MPGPLTIASDLLGPLTAEPSAVIHFPRGLLGFPECRSFVLLPSERDHVYWLQSVDYSALAFLLIDPFVFFPGYTVDLDTTDVGRRPAAPDDINVLAIVTLPQRPGEPPTANLQGPIVVDTRVAEGRQIVVPDSRYGIREALSL